MSEDPQALGARLRAERERRGMSTQKIANGMRVDEWVIEALESGDYQRIGPAVYAKGHLKKYASLLDISPLAPAAAALPVPARGVPPPPIVRLDLPKDHQALWPRIGTVAAAAVLAGGIFWWREVHQGSSVPLSATEPPAHPDVVPSRAPTEEGLAPATATAAVASPLTQAAATPATLSKAPSAGEADLTPGVGKARLQLSFSADSWVDIRDYSGKRLFAGNGRANSVKTIAGMAPFRVHLRSASGVQLQLNERTVAIGRQFVSGNEARFEAGADGVLRRDSEPAPAGGPPAGATRTAGASPRG